MRTTLLRALALLAPAMMLLGSSARGQELQYPDATTQGVVPSSYFAGNDDGRYYYTADDQKPAPAPAAAPADQTATNGTCGCNTCGGNACNSCGCNSCGCDCDDLCAACEDCPCSGLYLFSGFESFRGVSDGSYQSNHGIQNGFNFGSRLGALSDATGIGGQFGMSYNIYDFNGRFPSNAENNEAQSQLFITGGLFHKATEDSPWNVGGAYDLSINNNWGVYSSEPYLTQWRGQVGYALSASNEVGVWGAFHDKGFGQATGIGGAPVSYRSVAQANAFWHHKFEWGTDSWIWVGAPEHSKLGTGTFGNGSLGDFIIGGTIQAPIGPRLALYGSAQYMHPSAAAGATASTEETWYVATGIAIYPGCNARNGRTVAGQCWMPLMPVANNGNFMVDASRTR